MRFCKKWKGDYKSIGYTVLQHGVEEGSLIDFWGGYLYLNSHRHPDIKEFLGTKIKNSRWHRGGIKHNPFWDRFDWHCGVTFYDETIVPHHDIVRIKIGHHYCAPIWDDRETYNEEILERDLKKIIDQYREIYPENTGGN